MKTTKIAEFLKERPLSTYYDEVALPGLKLAQNDVTRGALDRVQAEKIKAAVLEVVDDLAEQDGKPVGRASAREQLIASSRSRMRPSLRWSSGVK
jgi:hypothetical protein